MYLLAIGPGLETVGNGIEEGLRKDTKAWYLMCFRDVMKSTRI